MIAALRRVAVAWIVIGLSNTVLVWVVRPQHLALATLIA